MDLRRMNERVDYLVRSITNVKDTTDLMNNLDDRFPLDANKENRIIGQDKENFVVISDNELFGIIEEGLFRLLNDPRIMSKFEDDITWRIKEKTFVLNKDAE